MRVLRCILLTLLLPGLLHAEPKADQGKLAEDAAMHRVELMLEKKDYELAEKKCLMLLENEKSVSALQKDEIRFMLGRSLEEQGKLDKAASVYAAVLWAGHRRVWQFRDEYMEAWIRVLWKRNKPGEDGVMGDREGAVESGRQYLDQMGQFKDRMNQEDLEKRQRLEKLVEQYEKELKKK